ncbi:MAG: UDP-N-acetylmuramoyl-tripeptide--D-alanyl-D-alanine ligase [Candidatus Jorgensenbacteria bacterium]|nr:UDP-N-acetylmuramoyl-tripeptide--D-alanyl-D-alanine ligase [Candidatus Jorgensenbacteria bacterium]
MVSSLLKKLLMWKLGLFARLTLRRYEPGVIAVTGSVGKTSTKEAIRAVVARAHHVRAAAKSFNNEIGVPLTILGDWEESGGILFWFRVFLTALANLVVRNSSYPEALVLEYAIDRPGDMDRLVRIAPPDLAVFTAMGDVPVHVEFFSGPEAVLHEKVKLVKALKADGFAILNVDDPKVAGVGDLTRGHVVTYGFREGADVRLVNFKNHCKGSEASVHFKLAHDSTVVPVSIPGALGRAEVYAAGAAAAVGLVFGMNLVEIAGALETYVPPSGRFRVLSGMKDTALIDSTYNASPLSMEEALETLKNLNASRKIAVLGDMLEIGKFTLPAHEELGKRVAKSAGILVTVGHRAKFIAEGALRAGMAKAKVHSFLTLEETGHYLEGVLKAGDLVLFKASQGVRLERVLKLFLAEPARIEELLVRQDAKWFREKGLYDEGELS